jgi:hypothetical protein
MLVGFILPVADGLMTVLTVEPVSTVEGHVVTSRAALVLFTVSASFIAVAVVGAGRTEAERQQPDQDPHEPQW